MTMNRFDLNIQYLIFGAKMGKLVEIDYRYIDKNTVFTHRFGSIQPIKWLEGREGLHILAWDSDVDNWRRFAVNNIEQVCVTDSDWTNTELKETLSTIPH